MSVTKRVLCILGEGFEEIEAVTPIDLLRRSGVEVIVASAGAGHHLVGRSNVRIEADEVLFRQSPFEFDMLLLPGGPAVKALRDDPRIPELAREFAAQGKYVAAICAAPLLLLDAGLLDQTRHTCHSSAFPELPLAELHERVVEDGRIITSRGAGTSLDFALTLVKRLRGPEIAAEVHAAIMA
jgi:4-methyl-5(b-hydroxyethyl)-thiazole monophosphate biosynthesis